MKKIYCKFFALLSFLLIYNFTFNIDNCEAQWQPDVRLTTSSADSNLSLNNARCIAANGSIVHIVYYDYRDGNNEIYYKRSSDNGISWATGLRLTNNSTESVFPSIAVSGSNVHVVWEDYRDGNLEIYFKRSTDGGLSWGTDTRLTNNSASSFNPSVAVSGSNVHVVWWDYRDGNYEIYYKRSTDGGFSWGSDARLTNYTATSAYPSISVSGTNVHVVWFDERDGNREIYYKRSTDGGVNWGTDKRLTNNSAFSSYPSISVSGSNVHVVWADYREGNDDIYYKRSADEGLNWGTDTRLTNNSANSAYPSVIASGSSIHVVWSDERDGNWEIYYQRSTDGGVNWESDLRLTNNNFYSEYPSITISGPIVHVAWQDNRNGNYSIYYKRNPTGNPIGIKNISTEIPSAYSLSQNYPNPFNSTSNLKFEIARHGGSSTSDVKIIVYDVMGREIQTLVNESLQPGTYETTFDGSMLPSGVYFYKLIAGDYTETKRMLMIK